jgi:transcriptional antiterminator RfaH
LRKKGKFDKGISYEDCGGKGKMVPKEESWFVCQTNARQEKRAKHYLEEKGFKVYLPMMETQVFVRSKSRCVQKPLFSNYLFVRFNEVRDLPFVRWTQGVRKILPESIRPMGVDDQLVESIRTFANRDGIIRKQSLKRRDRVRILDGPFKELMAVFEEWTSDRGRIRVLLECINGQTRLELHHTLVEKVA